MQSGENEFGANGIGDLQAVRASWKEAHESLQRLARERAGLDFEEGRWFLVALRGGAHLRLGIGTFAEYIERLFGYGPRFTQEKLRVAEALEALPLLSEELRSGRTSFSAVKELTRVATPETEQAWLEVARGKTVREVEKLVSGQRPGSLPGDVPEAGAEPHELRFEVSGEVFATFREAMAKVRREAGWPLDDDAVLLALARQVLGGPGDDGRSSYQVSLTICEQCRKGWQHGRGELIEVSDEVIEMAECDAQHIGYVGENAHVGASEGVHVGMSDGVRVGTSDGVHVAASDGVHVGASRVHVGTGRRVHVGTSDGVHVGTGRRVHVGASASASASASRAKQTVPPSIRRMVLARDHHRCRVPGCRCATFVDVHHRKSRSEGGMHTPDNLITLCSAHHAALHRGNLIIDGPPERPRFLHADGTAYGGAASTAAVEAMAKAFQGLRNLGYPEAKVRAALRKVQVAGDPKLEQLVREALFILH